MLNHHVNKFSFKGFEKKMNRLESRIKLLKRMKLSYEQAGKFLLKY